MKKLVLALAVTAALAACGNKEDPSASSAANTTAPSAASDTGSSSTASSSTMPSAPADTSTASSSAAPSTPPTPSTDSSMASSGASATGASATTTADASAGNTAAMGAAGGGQEIYSKTCQVCHGSGVAGAPKLGDKADWGPRVAQGTNVLYDHAIKGFTGKKGMMPPKGGNTALADGDVKAAVDYMVAQAK